MNNLITNAITFPCNKKIPAVKEWNKLTTKVPHECDYGILCGRVNNLTIIDCDLLKQEDDPDKYMCGVQVWNSLCEQNTFLKHLELPVVKTKSGGLHLYFQYCPELKSSVQKLNSNNVFLDGSNKIIKIDILSDNKFVVGPGSSGYTFINNSQYYGTPKMPSQLVDILNVPLNQWFKPKPCKTPSITYDQLQDIVDGIPSEFANNYQEWIKIVWAIAETSQQNGFDGLPIADQFSRRSTKYVSVDDVERVYLQNKGNITVGSLVYHNLKKERVNNKMEQLKKMDLEDAQLENTQEIINDLKRFDLFKDITKINNIKSNGLITNITCDDNLDLVIDNTNLSIKHNDQFIGHLKTILKFNDDVTPIHKDFDENGGDIYHMTEFRTDLVSKTKYGENRIKYLKNGKQKSIVTMVNGKQVAVKRGKKDISLVEEVIQKCCQEQLSNYNIVNIHGNVFNINVYNNDEDSIRSDDQLIRDMIQCNSLILNEFKFCSNDFGNFNGIYIYGPKTGIWRKEHNAIVNKMLTSRIKKHVPMLTEKEIKYCETQKNKTGLRMAFVEQIIDNDFESKIDESLHIFAMGNCVFDLNTKEIRKAIPQDFVYTNTGWDYNEIDADKYYNDVIDFFNKLFPVQEERDVVLTYLASLLHGYRTDKKLLAFTDKRRGDNGKTTLITLLRKFFGDYTKTNNNYFLKSNFGKDKDSHDGGTASLKGKRLLICDELKKSHRLDEGTVKNITGGANQEIQGRKMGKEDVFKFTIQCGVIIIFNEGDCPKFDATDAAFMQRLIIVPYRSKFTNENNPETYTFKCDCMISEKFELWRSSLLKLFIQYAKKECISNIKIPDSMNEWKTEILNENNVLKDWLWGTIHEDKDAFVSLNDLRDLYKNQHPGEKGFNNKDLERMINSLFNNIGVYIKERHRFYNDGKQLEKRNVFLGYNLN